VPNNILITPGSASIQFSGSAANIIRLQVEDSGNVVFYGSSGPVFGITDNSAFITGSLRMNSGGITGSLFGTSSVATSASYALSASYAPSSAGSGVTSITVSDGLSGGVITTTGTISLNTGSAHFLDGVKKELNTEGVISSSQQINTGSFTGSFIGTHSGSTFGTSSWASNAVSSSFATTAATASSFTGYINFPNGLDVTGSLYTTGSQTIVGTSTITGSLNILSGSINVTRGGITGSFTGSFSGSLDRFNPATLRIAVGTTAPASPATNDLWVDTN
jgi:hypothetical protein